MDRCVPVSVNGVLLNMVAPLDRCVPVSVNGIILNMVAPLDRCVPVSVSGIMLNMVAPVDRCVPVSVNVTMLNMVEPLDRCGSRERERYYAEHGVTPGPLLTLAETTFTSVKGSQSAAQAKRNGVCFCQMLTKCCAGPAKLAPGKSSFSRISAFRDPARLCSRNEVFFCQMCPK